MRGLFGLVFAALLLPVFPVCASALDNGSFELPYGTTNWTDSGWSVSGNAWRLYSGAWKGDRGVLIPGDTAGGATVAQDIPAATGTYTFTGWVRIRQGTTLTNLQLRLEWKDSSANDIEAPAVSTYEHLERDGRWRHIHVTGSCADPQLDFVRVTFVSEHDAKTSDPAGISFDHAEWYEGGYTGVPFLVNGGFEQGGTNETRWWYGSQWGVNPESHANSRRNWARCAGSWGGVLEGWVPGSFTSRFSQSIYPMGTGTWSFLIYLHREPGFGLSNAQLRLEWRDRSGTNLVQADSVADLSVPEDSAWYRYEVQGSCGDTNLFEITAVAEFVYGNDAGTHAMRMDEARLVPNGFTNVIRTDWVYHNHLDVDPRIERVPGTNSPGPFLQINYARTATTFYAITPKSAIARYPDSDGQAWIYISYLPPHLPDVSGNWITIYAPMTNISTITLTTNTSFHGAPVSGSLDFDLWQFGWRQPLSNGVPYSRDVKVYYAPYLRVFHGGVPEDEKYLVRLDGALTNNYPEGPQLFDQAPWDKDYFHYNLAHQPVAAFTNGGFETPATTNWGGASWQGYGSAAVDDWSAHSGSLGAFLPGWFTNRPGVRDFSECGVIQPVTTTGGTFTFAAWLRSDAGVNPHRVEMRIEWYDTNGVMVQVDRRDLAGFPRDGSWHHAHVTGMCLSNGLAYLVPVVWGQFWARTNDPDRIQVDDASLYAGIYTGVHRLGNGGFEQGNGVEFRGSQWYVWPEYEAAYRPAWGARIGEVAAQFDGKITNAPTYTQILAQNLTPGTGTYTFSIWITRDTNFIMEYAELRLGWYDHTFTNRVQDDDVVMLDIPPDGNWREYYVTGTCTNTALYEVRSVVDMGFEQNTNDGSTCRFDAARFLSGEYYPLIRRDWTYHHAGPVAPDLEQVPRSGAGSFRQVDYARTTTTFYVMTDYPDFASEPGQTGMVYLRTSYYHPVSNEWVDLVAPMQDSGTLDLEESDRFHGWPVSGSKTLQLYEYKWTQPLSGTGEPLTDPIWVYYTPVLRVYEDGEEADYLWLVQSGVVTNAYPENPQLFDSTFYGRDYGYSQAWTTDQDEDGLPDLWELLYFDSIADCHPAVDSDDDDWTNFEEYISDTNPRDENSYYRGRITLLRGGSVMEMLQQGPTTNSRRYDVWSTTNLVEGGPWVRYGHEVPGGGGDLWMVVTNEGPQRFFRTGVKLP